MQKRQVTSHKVAGNEKNELDIVVADEQGAGGANHQYLVYSDRVIPLECEINFQNGPIPANGINGITQEILLAIVADRLQCFQAGPYPCKENEEALYHVLMALSVLKQRTEERIKRQVEGQLKA